MNTDSENSDQPRFPALQIGSIELPFPAVQAPLSGYSDWAMRLIARRLEAPYTLCEVMLDQFLVQVKRRPRNQHFLFRTDEETPVGGQLMGAEAEQFAAGALRLVEAGFDVIDINFGCPVKKVLGKCRGGFHLSQPDVALDIVRRTRDAVPDEIPVTVKMRRGLDDSEQSRDNFFTILDGAFAAGVDAITVHGRTVRQRYVGPSDWSFLERVKRHVGDHTILGSGDLFSAQDCVNMLSQTGIDGVSIARGAIGNPWIFSQFAALMRDEPLPPSPSLWQQRDVILEHYRLADQLYGGRCAQPMRKFGIKYSALHPEHHQVRESFARVKNQAEWEAVLTKWYAEDLPGVYPTPAVHGIKSDCDDAA